MKKIVFLILFMIMAIPLLAGGPPVEVWPATQSKSCFSVSCSSNTATLFKAANTKVTAWTISNPSSSYVVYMATYPITAAEITTGGAYHTLGATKDYWEEFNPYQGAMYGLTQAGQSPIVITGELRSR